MSIKSYLWPVLAASFLALSSFVAIIWFFSPENAGWAVKSLMFMSLFLGLWGVFSLIGFGIYGRKRTRSAEELLAISFREGFFLSLLLVGFLLMRATNVFYWWSALIFLIVIVAIEVVILGKAE